MHIFWRSSHLASNYQKYKISNQLQFNYNTGVVAGTSFIWNTAGYVDTLGTLNWKKLIKTLAPVSSTSTSTGALIASAGGIGCSGNLNVGVQQMSLVMWPSEKLQLPLQI